MKPTRTTQPYRAGTPRQPGAALDAMRRGRTAQGYNPQDIGRRVAHVAALQRAGEHAAQTRKARKARPSRPARPAR